MAYIKYTIMSNPQNYGTARKTSDIKYLIFHYTANKNDRAKANANYFKNNVVKASAHYFVDDTEVYQSVPDLTVAYAVGGKKYSDCSLTGGGKMYGKVTNTNSISIEMCSVNGAISEQTMVNAALLGQKLMKKYNIPITNVYRHFDVNGKHCPGWDGWCNKDSSIWNNFKKKLSEDILSKNKSFQVKLMDNLNIRESPNGKIVSKNGAKKNITYTIIETSGTWGKLKSGAGWISISDKYVKKI